MPEERLGYIWSFNFEVGNLIIRATAENRLAAGSLPAERLVLFVVGFRNLLAHIQLAPKTSFTKDFPFFVWLPLVTDEIGCSIKKLARDWRNLKGPT